MKGGLLHHKQACTDELPLNLHECAGVWHTEMPSTDRHPYRHMYMHSNTSISYVQPPNSAIDANGLVPGMWLTPHNIETS